MKSIFNKTHTVEIVERIDRLSANSKPEWGTMQVPQMLAHCSAFQDIPMGNAFPPRGLLGRFVGRLAKPMFYNEKPLPHNMSTIPTIVIEDNREFIVEKEKLKQKITTFQSGGPKNCSSHPHPFSEN